MSTETIVRQHARSECRQLSFPSAANKEGRTDWQRALEPRQGNLDLSTLLLKLSLLGHALDTKAGALGGGTTGGCQAESNQRFFLILSWPVNQKRQRKGFALAGTNPRLQLVKTQPIY